MTKSQRETGRTIRKEGSHPPTHLPTQQIKQRKQPERIGDKKRNSKNNGSTIAQELSGAGGGGGGGGAEGGKGGGGSIDRISEAREAQEITR